MQEEGKRECREGGINPAISPGCCNTHSCLTIGLQLQVWAAPSPPERGRYGAALFSAVTEIRSPMPMALLVWDCWGRSVTLRFVQYHQLQDVYILAVEIGMVRLCSKNATPTLPSWLWLPTPNELTYGHTSFWRNCSPLHQTRTHASEPLWRQQKGQEQAVFIEQQISLEQMLGKKILLHFYFLQCLKNYVCLTSMCFLNW